MCLDLLSNYLLLHALKMLDLQTNVSLTQMFLPLQTESFNFRHLHCANLPLIKPQLPLYSEKKKQGLV